MYGVLDTVTGRKSAMRGVNATKRRGKRLAMLSPTFLPFLAHTYCLLPGAGAKGVDAFQRSNMTQMTNGM